jgi:hypothetical protein
MRLHWLVRISCWSSSSLSCFKRCKLSNEGEDAAIASAKLALKELKVPKAKKPSRPRHVSRRAQRLVERQTEIMIRLDDPAVFMGRDRRLRDKLESELRDIRISLRDAGYGYLIDHTHYLDHG